MEQPLVRPGFGPTLPELIGGWPRGARIAAWILVAAALLSVGASLVAGQRSDLTRVVVRDGVAFNVAYRAPMTRESERPGELLRFAAPGQTLVVRPLKLPAFRGQAAGFLPVYSGRVARQMASETTGLVIRGEGRVSINKQQGYELTYQATDAAGDKTYGKRIMMLPTQTSTEGIELWLEAKASPAIANPDAVGRNGSLKTTMRSFRFGTEGP